MDSPGPSQPTAAPGPTSYPEIQLQDIARVVQNLAETVQGQTTTAVTQAQLNETLNEFSRQLNERLGPPIEASSRIDGLNATIRDLADRTSASFVATNERLNGLQPRIVQTPSVSTASQAETSQMHPNYAVENPEGPLAASMPPIVTLLPPTIPIGVRVEPHEDAYHGSRRDQGRPKAYDGRKEGDAAKIWITTMNGGFHRKATLERVSGIPDAEKVALAVEALQGHAAAWWTLLARQAEVNPSPEFDTLQTNWTAWSKALCDYFPDIRTQESRLIEFHSIRQTTTVQDYVNELESARTFLNPRPDDQMMVHYFKRGLKPRILNKLRDIPISMTPQTYMAWKQEAAHREVQDQQNRDWQRPDAHRGAANNHHGSNRRGPASKDKDGDIEMKLNAMTSRGASSRARGPGPRGRGGFSDRRNRGGNSRNAPPANKSTNNSAERDDRKCFNCGKFGHISTDCRSKRASSGTQTGQSRGASRGGDRSGNGRHQ